MNLHRRHPDLSQGCYSQKCSLSISPGVDKNLFVYFLIPALFFRMCFPPCLPIMSALGLNGAPGTILAQPTQSRSCKSPTLPCSCILMSRHSHLAKWRTLPRLHDDWRLSWVWLEHVGLGSQGWGLACTVVSLLTYLILGFGDRLSTTTLTHGLSTLPGLPP